MEEKAPAAAESVPIRSFAKVPLALLCHPDVPGHIRILMAMAQGPEINFWSSAHLAQVTGLSPEEVRVYRRRCVKKGSLQEVGRGRFKITLPMAPEATRKALGDLTAFVWSDEPDTKEIRLVTDGVLSFPAACNTVRVLAGFFPWVLDPAAKEFSKFWTGVAMKARKLIRRTKRPDVEPEVFGWFIVRTAAEAIQVKGDAKGLKSPVGWLLFEAGKKGPDDLTDEVIGRGRELQTKYDGHPTIADVLGKTHPNQTFGSARYERSSSATTVRPRQFGTTR